MVSKNKSKIDGNEEIDIEVEPSFRKEVMLAYPSKTIVTTPEGNRYVWENPGDVLLVENQADFEYIINRKQPKSCCGGAPQQFIFIEV